MGTIRNGGNGGFSGKAGSFIGSNWKSIDYIKGIPRKSNKAPTQKQLDQRMRFGLVLNFLGQIKDILDFGFKSHEAGKRTGFNVAIQHALNNAIVGDYPNFEIDYSKILLSKATLAKPELTASNPELHKVRLEWMVNINTRNSFEGDKLFVVVYSPTKNLFLDFENIAQRIAGTVDITLQSGFDGEELHVYTFFQQHDSNRVSESVYAGAITMSNSL